MKNNSKQSLHWAANLLGRPAVLFYALPWLMFLLVTGTIAQRYIGLYESEKLFLGAFIFWLGPIPLPGAYVTLGIIGVSLMVKLALKSPWKKSRSGTIITHISVLVLLIGALITVLCRQEGYMVLAPGESQNIVSDYHLRELAILKNDKLLLSVPAEQLRSETTITAPEVPFSIHITAYYANSVPSVRKQLDVPTHGLAEKLGIALAPLRTEDAENQAGTVFTIHGAPGSQDGIYIASEALSQSPIIMVGADRYEILLRHAQRELPFAIRLVHFDKSDYPGTDMARSYSSDVTVKEGALEWNATIEMNQPLRHLGYTLYQSSYVESDGKLLSVLAVVKNVGAPFPYIAIATLCLGLLVHLTIMFMPKAKP